MRGQIKKMNKMTMYVLQNITMVNFLFPQLALEMLSKLLSFVSSTLSNQTSFIHCKNA